MIDQLGLMGVLLLFAGSALVVAAAGTRLARSADIIASRTRLGGLWVGAVLLAFATSLPELATSVSAVWIGAVDIAAGNLLGSSMANMLILGVLTLIPAGAGLFARAALDHVLAASLAIILNGVAGAFIVAGVTLSIGRIGAGSIVVLAMYLLGNRLLYQQSALAREAVAVAELGAGTDGADVGPRDGAQTGPEPAADTGAPRLAGAIIGFGLATLVVAAAAPVFAGAAERIATLTGISDTVVGTWLVGLATSLPEFVTSLAAVRMGAFDLAVGNLYGSNAVNIVMFIPLDLAHGAGPVLSAIDPAHAISVLMATVLMAMTLISLVQRARRRFTMLEPGGAAIIVAYVLGLLLIAWST